MVSMVFDHLGIGDLIKDKRLAVPPNQRSYAWEEDNVTALLTDINNEMSKSKSDGASEYFLGTVVLVNGSSGKPPQISDGQQRLATTSIIMARIRDLLSELGSQKRAQGVHQEYLLKTDLKTATDVSQITLNVEDNQFYIENILTPYPSAVSKDGPLPASNRRLVVASETIYNYFKMFLKNYNDEHKVDQLVRWIEFLTDNTFVVVVRVPNENDAFRIFETLNDRGVKAGQIDLLKNYFIQKAASRQHEAHLQWTELSGKLESALGGDDEQFLLYLRHLWITKEGHTTEKELSREVRKKKNNETDVAAFVTEANSAAFDYIALSSPTHPKWFSYPNSVKDRVTTISHHLRVEQIKPLMFAIARHFSPEEAEKAYRLAVSISVRFSIYGGRGGLLDKQYAEKAQNIGTGKITKARELRDAMIEVIPRDSQFRDAFANARVSKAHLARHYLRAIDKTRKGVEHPEFVANADYEGSNLEHVMPFRPIKPAWDIDHETASAAQNLLGNMVLITAENNTLIGNKSFEEKKAVYNASTYWITNEVGAIEDGWTLKHIKERQEELAKTAVKTWSLSFAELDG